MKKDTKTTKIKFKPAGDRVLVKPEIQEDQKTPSGIIIPDSAKKEDRQKGVVVAIGTGNVRDNGQIVPIRIKVGDKILFRANDWEKEELNGEEFYLVSESSILGTF